MRIPRPTATLAANQTVIDASVSPDTVRFTVNWAQKTHRGLNIPVTVGNWRWKADTAAQASNANCQYLPVANTCRISIAASGTMSVDVRLNGKDTTLTERVEVVPCLTGNPILDKMDLRRYLDTIWTLSRVSGPPAQRIERGFNTFDSTTTGRLTIISDSVAGDTPCRTLNSPSSIPFPGKLAVSGHTHPFSLGDTVPASCHPGQPGPQAYTSDHGGPSRSDWRRTYYDGAPSVVVDMDSIYVLEPHPGKLVPRPGGKDSIWKPDSGWQNSIHTYPRQGPGCTRPL